MFEHTSFTPPSQTQPSIITKAKEAYRVWHKNLINQRRIDRYTIGAKIDDAFLSLLELIFQACFAYDKFEKISLVSKAIGKGDLLRFIIQIAWEQKIVDNKNYSEILILTGEVGRMLGGWKKSLQEKTPANR